MSLVINREVAQPLHLQIQALVLCMGASLASCCVDTTTTAPEARNNTTTATVITETATMATAVRHSSAIQAAMEKRNREIKEKAAVFVAEYFERFDKDSDGRVKFRAREALEEMRTVKRVILTLS